MSKAAFRKKRINLPQETPVLCYLIIIASYFGSSLQSRHSRKIHSLLILATSEEGRIGHFLLLTMAKITIFAALYQL